MTNPWIEHIRAYAAERGIRYGDALKDPECRASYTPSAKQGGNIFAPISRGINRAAHKIEKTATKVSKQVANTFDRVRDDIKDVTDQLLHGSNEYLPKVRDYLNKIRGKEIVRIKIVRTPVERALILAMNAASGGKFGEELAKKDFDELFHLQLDIVCKDGTHFRCEKNEVINIEHGRTEDRSDVKRVEFIPPKLRVRDLFENALKKYGKQRFFVYDAKKYNCQRFVADLLLASGIGDQSDQDFIIQDTKSLFKGSNLKNIARAVTDTGARAKLLGSIVGLGIDTDGDDEEQIPPPPILKRAENMGKSHMRKHFIHFKL